MTFVTGALLNSGRRNGSFGQSLGALNPGVPVPMLLRELLLAGGIDLLRLAQVGRSVRLLIDVLPNELPSTGGLSVAGLLERRQAESRLDVILAGDVVIPGEAVHHEPIGRIGVGLHTQAAVGRRVSRSGREHLATADVAAEQFGNPG